MSLLCVVLPAILAWSAPAGTADPPPGADPFANHLANLDRIAGWELLFDGRSLAGWTPRGEEGDEGWTVRAGTLRLAPGGRGGDLVSTRSYDDFELELEWRVAVGGNSGVKYRVRVDDEAAPVGPEFQVLDDLAHADGERPETAASALYGLYEASPGERAAGGIWHTSRIVARGDRIEHWLDGERRVTAVVGSDEWAERLARSKFAARVDFGRGSGPILLQDHGDEVAFRSIRVRDLSALPGREVVLDAGPERDGWRELGDARWVGEGDAILGEVDGGSQSFLVTEEEFGDFLFEVDVRPELPGNSGIQVRSQVEAETERLFGYQIEIDSSERAWSGGLYDEGRRGWLDDLSEDARARAAFVPGDWNHYRIECVGPSVRAWVDGVPTADVLDVEDLAGVLGLQVHSGDDTRVRWRGLTLRDLGRHVWEALPISDALWRLAPRSDDELGRSGSGGRRRITSSWQPVEDGGVAFRRVDFPEEGRLALRAPQTEGTWRLRLRADEAGVVVRILLVSARGDTDASWELPLEDEAEHVVVLHAQGDRRELAFDGESLGRTRGALAGEKALVVQVEGSCTILGVEQLTPGGR